jgi:hypothetical protein
MKKIKQIKNCICDNGIIDCPACTNNQDKHKYRCACCKGTYKVTCGKCGGK